jgi:hypothetical protein
MRLGDRYAADDPRGGAHDEERRPLSGLKNGSGSLGGEQIRMVFESRAQAFGTAECQPGG